jgi:putative SOS response-associated peptidase YedK
MCFNLQQKARTAYKRAVHFGNKEDAEYWKRVDNQYDELFNASAFAHPEIIIYTNDKPFEPQLSIWGLVPHWAKDAKKIWNQTLNARGETIFEKPSFKRSAVEKRCLIPVEGFYEYHEYKNKKYPFFITHKEDKPLYLAGLWNDWTNTDTGEIINTFSIVTTKANYLMAKIHNKPKNSNDHRMPVILSETLTDEWLNPLSESELKELLKPYPDSELKAHTVRRLSGKESVGNVPEASEKFEYKELVFDEEDQPSLFT